MYASTVSRAKPPRPWVPPETIGVRTPGVDVAELERERLDAPTVAAQVLDVGLESLGVAIDHDDVGALGVEGA